METKTKIEAALKDAIRSGDEVGKTTLRMVIAAVKQAEIDRQESLDEAAVQAILHKEVKTRREAFTEAEQAHREDLATAAESEIAIIQAFLPKGLSTKELNTLAAEVIQEVGATSAADMGKVMKLLMERVQGRSPGDQVSQVVRSLLLDKSQD